MEEIKLFKRGTAQTLIPLFAGKIPAGFESPAADYEEARINLNDWPGHILSLLKQIRIWHINLTVLN